MTPNSKSNVRVLVVDDNSHLRDVISRTLTREGFHVTEAGDGRSAQILLEAGEDFDVIVSDIRMPKMSGIDLLYFVRHSFDIPVILITAFSELLEMRDAYEIGATGFLTKPFNTMELLSVLNVCLNLNEKVSPQAPSNLDQEFLEIGIAEFVSEKVTRADLYFRLSSHQYVKVVSQNNELDTSLVQSYIQKGVKHLYIKKA
jgi:DNA-binding NtrC family response regulator